MRTDGSPVTRGYWPARAKVEAGRSRPRAASISPRTTTSGSPESDRLKDAIAAALALGVPVGAGR